MTSKSAKGANGSGSVWKRPNGTWAAGLFVYESDGKRGRRVVYGRTRREALDKMEELRRKSDSGVPIAPNHLTLGKYLHEWLDEIVAHRVRPATLRAYTYNVEKFLEPDLGSKRLGKLTARELRQYLEQLKKRGVGVRTIRYTHATLRAALEDAMREELIEKNVAKLVRPPAAPKSEPKPLTVEELKEVFKANRDDRLFALLVVIGLLGLRRSEVLGLKWEDVDLEAGTLTVRRGLHRMQRQLVTMEPKTVRSRRTIPLPRLVTAALLEHKERQDRERSDQGAIWRDSGFVFTSTLGTPLDPDNTSKFVQGALVQAGVRKVRMHDFRHGCVSVLLGLGVPPRTVMEIAGHSGLEMTMNVYAHVTLDDKRDALDRLDALFGDDA